MTSEELNQKLIKEIPEIKSKFDIFVNEFGLDEGSHIVFEDVLVPFSIEQLEKNDYVVINKVFAFIENLLLINDEYAEEVCELSFLEPLKDNYDSIYDFSKVFGKKTLEIYNKIEL